VNLRLEAKSIRVRVSFQEAQVLLEEKQLSEFLPLPQSGLGLRVFCGQVETLGLQRNGRGDLELNVPRSQLETILAVIQSGKVDKSELELNSSFKSGAEDVSLCFEVDRFTLLKGRKELNK
jgi:hypothetical protein